MKRFLMLVGTVKYETSNIIQDTVSTYNKLVLRNKSMTSLTYFLIKEKLEGKKGTNNTY